VPALTLMANVEARRRPFRSLTAGMCCATLVMPFAVVDRQHRAIRLIGKELSEERTQTIVAMIIVVPATVAKPSAAVQRSQEAYARRQIRYEEAARLKKAGVSFRRIAALMGSERKTIRNWLCSGGAALWKKPPGAGVLMPYHDVLHRRWSEGCRNAALLWRELVDLGFSGRQCPYRRHGQGPMKSWRWTCADFNARLSGMRVTLSRLAVSQALASRSMSLVTSMSAGPPSGVLYLKPPSSGGLCDGVTKTPSCARGCRSGWRAR
jgi:hypothetical protein